MDEDKKTLNEELAIIRKALTGEEEGKSKKKEFMFTV